MQMSVNLNLDCSRIVKPLEEQAPFIEAELADRSLKQNLFGNLATLDLVRVASEQLVELIILGLHEGNLRQLQQQLEWEIGVSLHHHGLVKRETDLLMIRTFQQILNENLPLSLRPEIEVLVASIESVCEDCWNRVEQRWKAEQQLN